MRFVKEARVVFILWATPLAQWNMPISMKIGSLAYNAKMLGKEVPRSTSQKSLNLNLINQLLKLKWEQVSDCLVNRYKGYKGPSYVRSSTSKSFRETN